MLLDQHGKLKIESQCPDSVHDEVAHAVGTSSSSSSDMWTPKPTEMLVQLVAVDGLGDWQHKAEQLRSRFDELAKLDGEMVHARWDEVRPRVKHELTQQDLKRACGHTCGTCPTKSSCHLHEAVDIEIEDLAGQ